MTEEAKGRLRRLGWIAGGAVAALLALVLVFRGLSSGLDPGSGDFASGWRPIAVERGDLTESVVATGAMEPVVRVPVISEVSGIIAAVHVEEGDRVKRGQPLFELDRVRHEARLAQRRAELALREASARYDLVGRAEALRDHAKLEVERVRALFDKNVAPLTQLEDARHALRLATIDVSDARAETAARHAAVDQARELVRQAERDLENAVVRAPIDGVVIEREGEIGRAVADVTAMGGTIIAVIADDRQLRLVAEIDENDIAAVRVGQSAVVQLDAFPDEEFAGLVRKISSAGTTSGNVANFEVEIDLTDDERLRVGMSSDARVTVQVWADALLVPNGALVREDAGQAVRVPDVGGGAAFRLTPVRTAYSDGFRTVVIDGLGEGDVVLVRDESAG